MERHRLRILAMCLGVALFAIAGCSNDADTDTTTTQISAPPTGTVTSTQTPPPSSGTVTTTQASASSTTTSVAPSSTATATTVVPAPEVVEAGGWRLAVEQPWSGATIGSDAAVCYAVTGETREAIVALELLLVEPDTSTPVAEGVVDIAIGRGTALADFSAAAPGRYDMVITLELNGERRDDLSIRLAGVELDAAATAGTCR